MLHKYLKKLKKIKKLSNVNSETNDLNQKHEFRNKTANRSCIVTRSLGKRVVSK